MPLAEHIIIDRNENGEPRITVDGQVLPWWTLEGSIKVPAPSLKEMPSVTLTFLADKVTMVNDDQVIRDLADAQIARRLGAQQPAIPNPVYPAPHTDEQDHPIQPC